MKRLANKIFKTLNEENGEVPELLIKKFLNIKK